MVTRAKVGKGRRTLIAMRGDADIRKMAKYWSKWWITANNFFLFDALVSWVVVNTEQKSRSIIPLPNIFSSPGQGCDPSESSAVDCFNQHQRLVAFRHISCENLLQQTRALSLETAASSSSQQTDSSPTKWTFRCSLRSKYRCQSSLLFSIFLNLVHLCLFDFPFQY